MCKSGDVAAKAHVDSGFKRANDKKTRNNSNTIGTEYYPRYTSREVVAAFAKRGCRLRHLIGSITTMTEWLDDRGMRDYLKLTFSHPAEDDDCEQFISIAGNLYCHLQSDGAPSLVIYETGQSRTVGKMWMPGSVMQREAKFYHSTGSDAHFDLARQWIHQCETSEAHKDCQVLLTDQVGVPTRLLDLESLWTHGKKVQLCHSHELPSMPRYVTLSYRRGATKPLLLTDSTRHMLLQGCSSAKLPATFRDAIEITRGLGFSLWCVDSLCILQDSAQDWSRESAVMGDIYKGGALNIAARWSEDSSGGLFSTRRSLAYQPCCLIGLGPH